VRLFWEVAGCVFIAFGLCCIGTGVPGMLRHAGRLARARRRDARLVAILRRELLRDLTEPVFGIFLLLFGLSQQAGGQIPETVRSATWHIWFLVVLVILGVRVRRIWRQTMAHMMRDLADGQQTETPWRTHDEVIPEFVIDILDFFARRKVKRLRQHEGLLERKGANLPNGGELRRRVAPSRPGSPHLHGSNYDKTEAHSLIWIFVCSCTPVRGCNYTQRF
jgi:hypothetical protein